MPPNSKPKKNRAVTSCQRQTSPLFGNRRRGKKQTSRKTRKKLLQGTGVGVKRNRSPVRKASKNKSKRRKGGGAYQCEMNDHPNGFQLSCVQPLQKPVPQQIASRKCQGSLPMPHDQIDKISDVWEKSFIQWKMAFNLAFENKWFWNSIADNNNRRHPEFEIMLTRFPVFDSMTGIFDEIQEFRVGGSAKIIKAKLMQSKSLLKLRAGTQVVLRTSPMLAENLDSKDGTPWHTRVHWAALTLGSLHGHCVTDYYAKFYGVLRTHDARFGAGVQMIGWHNDIPVRNAAAMTVQEVVNVSLNVDIRSVFESIIGEWCARTYMGFAVGDVKLRNFGSRVVTTYTRYHIDGQQFVLPPGVSPVRLDLDDYYTVEMVKEPLSGARVLPIVFRDDKNSEVATLCKKVLQAPDIMKALPELFPEFLHISIPLGVSVQDYWVR